MTSLTRKAAKTALSILRERYTRGEIRLEEYDRRVEPLVPHEPAHDRR